MRRALPAAARVRPSRRRGTLSDTNQKRRPTAAAAVASVCQRQQPAGAAGPAPEGLNAGGGAQRNARRAIPEAARVRSSRRRGTLSDTDPKRRRTTTAAVASVCQRQQPAGAEGHGRRQRAKRRRATEREESDPGSGACPFDRAAEGRSPTPTRKRRRQPTARQGRWPPLSVASDHNQPEPRARATG